VVDLESGRALWNRIDRGGDAYDPALFSPDDRFVGTRLDFDDADVLEARTGRLLIELATDRAAGFGEDGQLLVVREGVLCRADGQTLAGLHGESIEGVNSVDYASTFGSGRFVLVRHNHEPSAVSKKIGDWLSFVPLPWSRPWYGYEVLDLRSGQRRGAVSTTDELCMPSPDGLSLLTFRSSGGLLRIWHVSPRRPSAVVLGLMIVQVLFLIVWTIWTKRARRPRCVAL
jgi:hypothetical protein